MRESENVESCVKKKNKIVKSTMGKKKKRQHNFSASNFPPQSFTNGLK